MGEYICRPGRSPSAEMAAAVVRTDSHKVDEEAGAESAESAEPVAALKGKKSSWGKLRRFDSFSLEAGRIPSGGLQEFGWERTLSLAFQSLGVVYGDIGTSPLYVYSSTFTEGIKEKDDILGVLSLILYTLIIIPLIKYVFIVLWANDDGNGGTFALYTLISRHARISLIPNQQAEDAMLSNYKLETPSSKLARAQWIKDKFGGSKGLQVALFLLTILATSMIIGDGVLTPAISGEFSLQNWSSVQVAKGMKFSRQSTFSSEWDQGESTKSVTRASYYNLHCHLGASVLISTLGHRQRTEAMFADLSHFNVRAIQVSFSAVLLPAVSLAYIGQASYLTKFPEEVNDTFYKSIPGTLFWPTFIVAIAAAIIASQAMISGAFSIIQQSQGLSCFPRVRVVHTSTKYHGQVYIPEINYALMIACVFVTGIFRSTANIGNAYGIAVVCVMLITTVLVALVMLMVWKTSILWISLFVIFIGGIEAVYLSAVLSKFIKGGYLPVALSIVLMLMMGIWHYVHVKHYKFELEHKVSGDYIHELAADRSIARIPGIGLLYSELVQGIPPIFPHFIDKIPSIHSVLVFVSVKRLPISKDSMEEAGDFEKSLVKNLKEFIHHEIFVRAGDPSPENSPSEESETTAAGCKPRREASNGIQERQVSSNYSSGSIVQCNCNGSSNSSSSAGGKAGAVVTEVEEETRFIQKEMEKGWCICWEKRKWWRSPVLPSSKEWW
ncbi:Potassium transporter 5 [Platanthera guangdongensis]|uniref:Potassium transporter 5 n=1 Tax=Platanthera guangdongensis TaxID=2320717 RepID=A0ABR2N3S9_9ASPA